MYMDPFSPPPKIENWKLIFFVDGTATHLAGVTSPLPNCGICPKMIVQNWISRNLLIHQIQIQRKIQQIQIQGAESIQQIPNWLIHFVKRKLNQLIQIPTKSSKQFLKILFDFTESLRRHSKMEQG